MRRLLAVVAISGLMITACSDDPTSSEEYQKLEQQLATAEQQIDELEAGRAGAGPPGTAPFHPVPGDAVFVSGTAACEITEDGVDLSDPEEGPGGLLAVCEFDMSDSRVSGIERTDRFRILAENLEGMVWVVEDATLINDEGTWRGTVVAGDSGQPCGEAHYVGEGAYEGLQFHYYFCGIDEDARVRGWISGTG